jgi:hypothetical protein
MTKVINYVPKQTTAKTIYRELREEDHTWLLSQLSTWLVKMATLSNTTNEDLRALRDQYWRKRRTNLPKGKDGTNSPESMVAGILDNMLYSTNLQRDFSEKQCDAIEDISRWMNAFDPALEDITFQIGLFQ